MVTANTLDGEAFRIEYDNKLERVEFFNEAGCAATAGTISAGISSPTTQRRSVLTVKSTGEAPGTEREGRVRATIMPKKQAEPQTAPVSGASRQD